MLPLVEGAAADAHDPAQHRYRIGTALLADEAILHSIAFKALAFFRISFSIRSALTSLCNRTYDARSLAFKHSLLVSQVSGLLLAVGKLR